MPEPLLLLLSLPFYVRTFTGLAPDRVVEFLLARWYLQYPCSGDCDHDADVQLQSFVSEMIFGLSLW
jgi:hypothetical protein